MSVGLSSHFILLLEKTVLVTPEAPAHPCLLQCYSQQPSYGNNQDAPLLMNGLRKCGYIFIHNGILLRHEEE
jgi:hypothetical protein